MAEDDQSDSSESSDDATNGGSGELRYVMPADELDPGSRLIVQVEGKEVGIFRDGDEFHALLNFCVHQGGPICRGRSTGTLVPNKGGDGDDLRYEDEDQIVCCPWHGWEFDIASGEHVAPTGYEIPTYDVEVIDGDLYLRL